MQGISSLTDDYSNDTLFVAFFNLRRGVHFLTFLCRNPHWEQKAVASDETVLVINIFIQQQGSFMSPPKAVFSEVM